MFLSGEMIGCPEQGQMVDVLERQAEMIRFVSNNERNVFMVIELWQQVSPWTFRKSGKENLAFDKSVESEGESSLKLQGLQKEVMGKRDGDKKWTELNFANKHILKDAKAI